MSTKITADIGLDLVCVICAVSSVVCVIALYAVVLGWVSI
jgi:hypothetical protein